MKLILFTLTLSISSTIGDRIFPFNADSDDNYYSSYQLSPILPMMVKPGSNYQSMNRQRSNLYRPSPDTNYYSGSSLQALPSIMSPASIPFIVFGGSNNNKKVSNKKISPTNIDKSIYSSGPKTQDAVDWSAEDMMQHPIDEAPRKSDRALGHACSYSSDCGSGCCLLDRNTKIRSCQPLARMGDKCSKSQVKGDLYVDACPCMRGADLCGAKNRCTW